MSRAQRARLVLAGLAAGVLIALIAVPATRWIVIRSAATALPFSGSNARAQWSTTSEPGQGTPHRWHAPWDRWTVFGDPAADRATADRHPRDFVLQLGAATQPQRGLSGEQPGRTTAVHRGAYEAVLAMIARFRDNPAIYATALRLGAQQARSVRDWPPPTLEERRYMRPPTPADIALVATFGRLAAQGERLDPGNAFYPMMRAWALFNQHRDAEAIAALYRAGQASRFEDYAQDETRARIALAEATSGPQSALRRLMISASLLFPDYARLRSMARVADHLADVAEEQGRVQEAIAIRGSLMRCGALMRVQRGILIGPLVGIAIEAIGGRRPERTPATVSSNAHRPPANILQFERQEREREQRKRQARAAYCAWLAAHRDTAEAAWARAEFAASDEALQTLRSSRDDEATDPVIPAVRLFCFWLAGMLLLADVAWLALFGFGAGRLARRERIRSGAPVALSVQIGVALGIVAALRMLAANSRFTDGVVLALLAAAAIYCAALVAAVVAKGEFKGIRAGAIACVLSILAVATTWLIYLGTVSFVHTALMMSGSSEGPGPRPEVVVNVGIGVLPTLAALAVVILVLRAGFATRRRRVVGIAVLAVIGTLALLAAGAGIAALVHVTRVNPWWPAPMIAGVAAVALSALTVPLIIVALIVAGLIRRVPLSAALVRGVAAGAAPIACVLVIAYGGVVLATVQQEAVLNALVTHMTQNEGAYHASLTGRSWPGLIPPPPLAPPR